MTAPDETMLIEVYHGDEVAHRVPVVTAPPLPEFEVELPVKAALNVPTNAELIAHVAAVDGLIGKWTCDLTYGRGLWWKKWRPETLTPYTGDFRGTGFPSDFFDTVAYDPPYISMGGRATSGITDFMDRFGLETVPKSPQLLQEEIIEPGLDEAARIVKPGGTILVKTMDYISSGKYQPAAHWTREYAESIGLTEVCTFLMVKAKGGPQPQHARQVHPRNNWSMLVVLRR